MVNLQAYAKIRFNTLKCTFDVASRSTTGVKQARNTRKCLAGSPVGRVLLAKTACVAGEVKKMYQSFP